MPNSFHCDLAQEMGLFWLFFTHDVFLRINNSGKIKLSEIANFIVLKIQVEIQILNGLYWFRQQRLLSVVQHVLLFCRYFWQQEAQQCQYRLETFVLYTIYIHAAQCAWFCLILFKNYKAFFISSNYFVKCKNENVPLGPKLFLFQCIMFGQNLEIQTTVDPFVSPSPL